MRVEKRIQPLDIKPLNFSQEIQELRGRTPLTYTRTGQYVKVKTQMSGFLLPLGRYISRTALH